MARKFQSSAAFESLVDSSIATRKRRKQFTRRSTESAKAQKTLRGSREELPVTAVGALVYCVIAIRAQLSVLVYASFESSLAMAEESPRANGDPLPSDPPDVPNDLIGPCVSFTCQEI
jgi:hypothetical protein